MITVNDALRLLGLPEGADTRAVLAARRRLAKRDHPDIEGGDTETMRRINEAVAVLLRHLDPVPDPAAETPASHARTAHDVCSFVIEALPVIAFEALRVVTSWLGEAVTEEPPAQLDVLVLDPLRCWCRLDLLPDAGASTVSLTIAALPDETLPDIDDVRDLWVDSLNRLGR